MGIDKVQELKNKFNKIVDELSNTKSDIIDQLFSIINSYECKNEELEKKPASCSRVY
jgi:predicted Zn-ribbon and HTH transcriptional regulator